MPTNLQRGRVYRRCGCRGADGSQLGARCPRLATDTKHGTWTFAVDMPSLTGRRSTMRRSGFSTKSAAQAALNAVLAFERSGLIVDDRQTVADYLTRWLPEKALVLKPTTVARYTDYVTKDLIPAFGTIRLVNLNHQHIALFIRTQLDAGRGLITLRRCIATLSSALTDAVRHQRLPRNVAKYAKVPRPPKRDRACWSPSEAARFLRHCAAVNDPLTDLYEVIISTGMRKGEALGLHWTDVHLDERVLFVRHTLSSINNSTPVFTGPKTHSSRAWIGLSDRVLAALQRQAERQPGRQLVFTRHDGQPLRPEYVLRHFHQLTAQAGLPRIRSATCGTSRPPPC